MKIRAEIGDEPVDVIVARSNGRFVVTVGGTEHHVDARKLEGDFYSLIVDGRSYEISVEWNGAGYYVRHGAAEQLVRLADPGHRAREQRPRADGPAKVVSVMPGKVVRLLVAEGEDVERGQSLLVVEAMKMENEIASPRAGRVQAISVEPGRTVEAGEMLLMIG